MICLSKDDINIYFDSINKAAKYFNTSDSNIRRCVREGKTYKGYTITKDILTGSSYSNTNVVTEEDISTVSSYSSSYCITEEDIPTVSPISELPYNGDKEEEEGFNYIKESYFSIVCLRFSMLLFLLAYLYNLL